MIHENFHQAVLACLDGHTASSIYEVRQGEFDWSGVDTSKYDDNTVCVQDRGMRIAVVAKLSREEYLLWEQCLANEYGDTAYIVATMPTVFSHQPSTAMVVLVLQDKDGIPTYVHSNAVDVY